MNTNSDLTLEVSPMNAEGLSAVTVRMNDDVIKVDSLSIVSQSARDDFIENLLTQFPALRNKQSELADLLQREAANCLSLNRATRVSTEAEQWEPPIPLSQYNLPAFPLEALPEPLCELRELCEAVAESFQVPVDLPVLLMLGVGGAALAKRVEVHIRDDWTEPVNIYVAPALEPAERKSAVFRLMTDPLTAFEREDNERRAPEIAQSRAEYEILIRAFDSAKKLAATSTKKADARDEARKRVIELANEIEDFKRELPLQLVVDDITPESLANIMHEQGGRIALFSAEGDVWDMMAGRYSDGKPNLGNYLKGHAGDDIRVNRVSKDRPPNYIVRPALTICVTVQPDVLRGLMYQPKFRGRGLLARWVYSLPASRLGYRIVCTTAVPAALKIAYSRRVRSALSLCPLVGECGIQRARLLRPDSKALLELDRFRLGVEVEMRGGGSLSSMKDWAGKAPGLACRFAGILHGLCHVEDGDPSRFLIDEETMLSGIAITEYAIEHARAAYFEMGASASMGIAKRILAWLSETKQTVFTKRDAFERFKGTVHRVDGLDEPLRILIEHGYLLERKTERSGPGRKPSTIFDVNPHIDSQYSHNSQNAPSTTNSANTANCANGV